MAPSANEAPVASDVLEHVLSFIKLHKLAKANLVNEGIETIEDFALVDKEMAVMLQNESKVNTIEATHLALLSDYV